MHIACCNMHIAKESILRLTYIYIFRFRSYLVTDKGRTLVAKGELVNFCEAYLTCWANALVNEMSRDCTVVIEGVGAR
jgi:hypothetical protein